jgi:YNFM family putative membrane transporter
VRASKQALAEEPSPNPLPRGEGFDRRRMGVAVAGFATFINMYAPQSLLPTLADAFGASAAHTGLTVTASLLAVAFVAPFVGGISDAFGRRKLILGASFALGVPTLLAALAPTLELLILCRFAQGLLLPFIFAVSVAYIADECPGAAGVRATGSYAVGTILGGFLGRFIAGWVAQYLGWRASFVVLAGLTLAAALVIATLLPPERNFRPVRSLRGTLEGFAAQLHNTQVLATCAVGFAVLFSIVAAFTYANIFLAAPPYGLGPAQLGTVFVVYLLGAVATPTAARLTVTLGRRRMVVLAFAVVVAGLGLTLVAPLTLIVLGLGLIATGVLTEQTISIGYVAVAGESARSTAVGLYVTCYYIGGSLGGVAPAWIWSHAGWPGCVALVLLVQAAAIAVTWLVWPRSPAIR